MTDVEIVILGKKLNSIKKLVKGQWMLYIDNGSIVKLYVLTA